MNFSLYIAKRYLFSKSSSNAINIITFIATFGVFVSALVLFILLSVFSGLRTFSYSLLEASDPDIKITSNKGKSFLSTDVNQKILLEKKIATSISKVVEERAFLQHNNKNVIAHIKGVDHNYINVIAIDSVLSIGTWLDNEFPKTAVIGNGISYKLSTGISNFGDALQITVPKPGKGFINPNNAFNSDKVQIIGSYGGTEDFQNKYVFTHLSFAQNLLNYQPNEISALEVKINSNFSNQKAKEEIKNILGDNFNVRTREELNPLFYKVINNENFIGYLIGTFITIIALFNILGSIVMMILDKKENLKTLFKLGTPLKEIKQIFVFQGFLLTLLGTFIGLTSAIIIVIVQQKFQLLMITQNIPYPIEFRFINVIIVILTITILGYIGVKVASSRITKEFIES